MGEWVAYIVYGDEITLVKVQDHLMPLFDEWKTAYLPFSFNGYTEGAHPHLSIRLPEAGLAGNATTDLEKRLSDLNSELDFSFTTQPYDEKEAIRYGYVLGSYLAVEAYRLKTRLLPCPVNRKHVVHGFVNSLGFFHSAEEIKLYEELIAGLAHA